MTLPYQQFPDNPPTNVDDVEYYEHRKLIYAALNTFLAVPKPTGVAAQDTVAIQTQIDAAIYNNKGCTVILHPGTYIVNDTIDLRGVAGLRIIGNGSTTIQSSVSPAIKMAHCRECVLDGFTVTVAAGNIGIQCLRDNNPNSIAPTMNTFRNLLIQNGAYSIVLGGDGFVNANNDFNLFENVRANNYTHTGFKLEGSQSYGNIFRNCFALGAVGASYGIDAGGSGGHFQWYGGGMSQNGVDFGFGRSYQPYIIEGANNENSDRFIEQISTNYVQFVVRGCRWAGNSIHADLECIKTSTGITQAKFEYNSISDGGADTATLLNFGSNVLNHIEFIGNRVFSTAADVFNGVTPNVLEGNVKITNEGLGTTVALT